MINMIYFIGPKANYSESIQYATIEEAYEYLKDKQEIGIDIETTRKYAKNVYREDVYKPGLDPYVTNVVMLQIGDLENIYVIDVRTIDITILLPLLEDESKIYVGANLKFEAKHLKHKYGINFRKIWDVMLVEINLTNGLGWSKTNHKGYRYSLLAISSRYFGIKNQEEVDLFNPKSDEDEYIDKSTRMGFLTIGENAFTESQILYGADDITYPLKIKAIQEKGIKDWNPSYLHELENEFCLVLADIELKGLGFEPKQWMKVYYAKEIVYNKRLEKINQYVIKTFPKFCTGGDLFDPTPKCSIMWTSSDQVIALFKHLKICPKEKSKQTKRMEYTVGAKALGKLLTAPYKEHYMRDEETDIVTTEDLILNYLLLKKSEQAVTTFGEDWLKHIHPITGRIHTSYTQILNTGRISSNNPNVQNIPSEKEYRMAFVGNLINCDYASQESRVLAEICGDKDMLSFFNDGHPIFGDDFHSFVGTKMFRVIRNEPDLIITKKTHPKERQDAKQISFKTAYGGSAYTMKDDFGVEESVAQEFIDGYFDAFPSLKQNFEDAKAKVLKLGYIEIDKITGRRWFDANFEKMNALSKKAWSFFPDNYRHMNAAKKAEVKKKVNEEHPELKEIWSEFFSLQGKLTRNALNFRIQGLAAGQTKKAGILFRRKQLKDNLYNLIDITNLIHDEGNVECAEGYEDLGQKVLQDCMEQGAQEFCSRVKMKAEAVKTSFWYH